VHSGASDPQPAPRIPHPAPITILIEPSRGFGTGHHQSTRLCIVLLQNRNLSGLTVTDVGTGSGVLAITAAKLGAAFVSAIDNDPDAVENARENIAANGVEKIVEAHVDDLSTTTVPPADLVTANLTGTLLAHHAADLARLVRPSGSLLVSGFNVDDKDRVIAALAPYFAVTESAEEDDWFAFLATVKR
jgi:ribosomal protein L11 methyltransferase